ncbi:MAG: type 1 glutamine amidotransferase [Rhodospirillales bacterium]|nr:type 1 glutamine amidotransferase [Rhodospirillales bacterium]
MRDRPVIGVTSSRHRGRIMWWFNRFAVWRAGGHAIRLEPHRQVDWDALDGLILGGGEDISADLYGGSIVPEIRIDPERDRLELMLLGEGLRRDLPALGICRGAQMINVHLGGSLHEEVREAFAAAPDLRTPLPRKWIRLLQESRVQSIIGKERDRVNALHHQAIDRLGRGLRVAARDEHGVVQAIECPQRAFLLGVQWHPEFMVFDPGQQKLYSALVDAARPVRLARQMQPHRANIPTDAITGRSGI